MGHAGRSVALIEQLVGRRHRVLTFSFGDGCRLLDKLGYRPQAIEGLRFQQTASGAVDACGTLRNFRIFLRSRQRSIDFILQMARCEQPDLFITDFEPLTCLAAAALRIPCVSLDNQHRFCHPLESNFPSYLRWYCAAAGVFVRRWIKQTYLNIVAAFHRCPPSNCYRSVDAIIRGELATKPAYDGDHLLVYARQSLGRRIAQSASRVPETFYVYGFDGPPADNLHYRPYSYLGFAQDLASCRAVICQAGQQMLAEAGYFGKPALAIPMPNQHEQEINARYVRREGLGDFCPIGSLTSARIQRFLGRPAMFTRRPNGVEQVLDLLRIGYG
jgi:uncharacterized protein (TIGR00661 family)